MNARPVGINTYGYIWSHPLPACLRQLADAGYRHFEGVINPPHLDIDAPPGLRHEIRDYMQGEGLSFTSLNLPSLDTNLASPFACTREYTIQMFCKALQLAHDLGAPRLVTVPGRLNPLLPGPVERSRAAVQDTIGALIPMAHDLGVRLAIENVPFAALPRAADIRNFLNQMGNTDVLCACYDIANAHFIGESAQEGFAALHDHIQIIHCSDTTRNSWRHDPIGRGDVPFAALADALHIHHYDGPVLLEIIDQAVPSSILQSHDALANLGVVAPRKS